MIRSLLVLLGVAMIAHADDRPEKLRVYFGTYTGAKSKGIYRGEFDLKTGAHKCPPATQGIKCYKVQVTGDDIEVDIFG